jgi:hypothetical protein
VQGFLFIVIKHAFALPLLPFIFDGGNLEKQPVYWLALMFTLLVLPILLPIAWKRLLSTRFLGQYLQQPYATPWDYYFDRRKSAFMVIHLNNGNLVGGYWGPGSYASAFPEQGDLYLSDVYAVDSSGRLGEPVPSTAGMLIRRDQYTYIELFSPPTGEPEV